MEQESEEMTKKSELINEGQIDIYLIDDIVLCCNDMRETVMMNEFREGVVQIGDALYIKWGDGDCMPLNYCPSCGKKIERAVKE